MTIDNSDRLEHAIGVAGSFQLRQVSGQIEIRGVDGDTVRVHERSGKSLGEAFRIEAGEGRLTMTSPDRGGIDLIVFGIGRRSNLDLEVDVPRGAEISIETAGGDIEATGLTGRTKMRTASGDMELTNVSGALELDAVSGEVEVTCDGPADLRLRTISGDCTVRGPQLGQAIVETTSGDVRLDALLAGPGPFEIQTVSGDATIVGRTGIRVEARTVTGDLNSDLPHRMETSPGRKQLIVGDGGTAVSYRSVSGDLRIVAPRDGSTPAAVAMPARPTAPRPPTAPSPPALPARPVLPQPAVDPRAAEEARASAGHEAGHEVARLDILHALERGELSVEAAMKRLADIEEA